MGKKTEKDKTTIVLHESVLNDDEIEVAAKGCYFKHNGRKYKYHVTYWTYRNSQCNDKHEYYSNSVTKAMHRYDIETERKRLKADILCDVLECAIENDPVPKPDEKHMSLKSYWVMNGKAFPTLDRAKMYIIKGMTPQAVERDFESGKNYIRHFANGAEVAFVRYLPGDAAKFTFSTGNPHTPRIQLNMFVPRFTRVHRVVRI